jgi:hypothetical protein
MPAISNCRSPSNSSGSLHERVTKTYHSLVPTPDLRRNRSDWYLDPVTVLFREACPKGRRILN